MSEILKTLFWKSGEEGSLEHFSISKTSDQYVLEGVVLCSYGDPTRVDYKITTSSDWHTQSVEVSMLIGKHRTELRLAATSNQEWLLNKKDLTLFKGLIDVDLGITPSTNTLPINRLNLEVGESAELTALWIRFPELMLEPLAQRYTRLTDNTYHYENTDGSFSAELLLDKAGIVETYGNIWSRVATL
jgi:uncharacterized protein